MAQSMDSQHLRSDEILKLATEVVAAYVSNNPIPVSEVPTMIKTVLVLPVLGLLELRALHRARYRRAKSPWYPSSDR